MRGELPSGLQPVMFVLLLLVLWNQAIRAFHVPSYRIPAPMEVVRSLWTDWPELLSQAVPTADATLAGFALSAASASRGQY